jgi:competence protein ComEC
VALAALAWMAGVAGQLQQPALWAVAVYGPLCAAGLLGLVWAWRSGRRWRGLLALLALGLLGFASTGWRATQRLGEGLGPALEGADLLLTGRVADMPQVDADGLRFAFAVEQAELPGPNAGPAVAVPHRVWLGWGRGWQEDALLAGPPAALRGGERWRLPVRLRRPHGAMNPAGFDAELWLFEQDLRAVGSVRPAAGQEPQRLEGPRWWHPGDGLAALRQHLRDRVLLAVGADARAAGVLAALGVGDQSAIDGNGWDLFRQTGVAHLMSISGLHITLFAWLAGRAVGALWRRGPGLMHRLPAPTAARWGGLALALAYSALAGWGVPAQRTVLMLAVTVVLHSAGLRWPALLVCLVAGAAVSLADPWALLQPGFWLSFMAVALLMSSEPVRRAPATQARQGWRARAWVAAREGLHAQWVATLGLAPLAMVFFQQLSLVGLFANGLAVPVDRKSTRLNSSHRLTSRMPSSA